MLTSRSNPKLGKRLVLLLTAILYFTGSVGPYAHVVLSADPEVAVSQADAIQADPHESDPAHDEWTCAICQGLRAVSFSIPGALVPQESFIRVPSVCGTSTEYSSASVATTRARAPPSA